MQETCVVGTLNRFYSEECVTLEIRVPRDAFEQDIMQCHGQEMIVQLQDPATGSVTDLVRIPIHKCLRYGEQLARDFLTERVCCGVEYHG